mgnify:CR=1 FL=1
MARGLRELQNFFARRLELVRHRLYKHGFLRNMSLFAFV